MTQTLLAKVVGASLVGAIRLATGVQANWQGCMPAPVQRIYFANHTSHGDFLLLWAALPHAVRSSTRPVAGADYWETGALRRFLSTTVFNAVLIDRAPLSRGSDPVAAMVDAVDKGASLILFPEGTRNLGSDRLQPFKSGLFHLACARPTLEFVPVWIQNLNRVLPKGEIFPIPLLCTVTFGAPLVLGEGEEKTAFLARARLALLALAPPEAG